jgi:hypothetical protein
MQRRRDAPDEHVGASFRHCITDALKVNHHAVALALPEVVRSENVEEQHIERQEALVHPPTQQLQIVTIPLATQGRHDHTARHLCFDDGLAPLIRDSGHV